MAIITETLLSVLRVEGLAQHGAAFRQASRDLSGYTDAIDRTQARQAQFSAAAAGFGLAAAAGFAFFGRAVQEAGEEAAIFQRASGNFKGTFPQEELQQFASGLQDLTGVADDSIGSFIGLLGTFGTTRTAAERLALPILNAAEALKAQGVSTEQLAVQVGKALETGQAGALRRSGIIIDQVGFASASAAGRVDLLAEALQRQGGEAAVAFAGTLPGRLQALRSAFGNLREAAGEPLIGPLTTLAKLGTDAARAFTSLPGPVKAAASILGVGLVGALGLASAASGLLAFRQTQLLGALVRTTAAARTQAGVMAGTAGVGVATTTATTVATGAAAGAARGGLLGRLGGPWGLLAGLVVGGAIGGIAGGIGGGGGKKSPHEQALDENTAALRDLKSSMDQGALGRGEAYSTRDVPGAYQVMASLARAIR